MRPRRPFGVLGPVLVLLAGMALAGTSAELETGAGAGNAFTPHIPADRAHGGGDQDKDQEGSASDDTVLVSPLFLYLVFGSWFTACGRALGGMGPHASPGTTPRRVQLNPSPLYPPPRALSLLSLLVSLGLARVQPSLPEGGESGADAAGARPDGYFVGAPDAPADEAGETGETGVDPRLAAREGQRILAQQGNLGFGLSFEHLAKKTKKKLSARHTHADPSSWCPCVSGADLCLQPDGVPPFPPL